MKTHCFSTSILEVLALKPARASLAAFGLAVLSASAEVPANLDIQTYAGLTLTGTIGTVYSVEYVTDLAQANDPSAWRCLEYLQLPASPYLWTDKSTPATGRRFYRAVVSTAPTNMVFIPSGTFLMGSPTNEVGHYETEGPQTAVTISRGYWMGKYEVTQEEYLGVMGNNPSWFQPPNVAAENRRPVENVSWLEATDYCIKLTEQERLAGRIASNSVYRLPTEAEWEYACRGWTSTQFGYGDDPGYIELAKYAWYGANSEDQTHPVGQKQPNPWGAFDMHGNVYEWCQDWYAIYSGGVALDPQGPQSGSAHVIRGGDWSFMRGQNWHCRSAFRVAGYPDWESGIIHFGFRVVLAPGQP